MRELADVTVKQAGTLTEQARSVHTRFSHLALRFQIQQASGVAVENPFARAFLEVWQALDKAVKVFDASAKMRCPNCGTLSKCPLCGWEEQ